MFLCPCTITRNPQYKINLATFSFPKYMFMHNRCTCVHLAQCMVCTVRIRTRNDRLLHIECNHLQRLPRTCPASQGYSPVSQTASAFSSSWCNARPQQAAPATAVGISMISVSSSSTQAPATTNNVLIWNMCSYDYATLLCTWRQQQNGYTKPIRQPCFNSTDAITVKQTMVHYMSSHECVRDQRTASFPCVTNKTNSDSFNHRSGAKGALSLTVHSRFKTDVNFYRSYGIAVMRFDSFIEQWDFLLLSFVTFQRVSLKHMKTMNERQWD